MRVLALVTLVAFATGCFGYNRSAKRWAYVGDTVLILGGGGLIAADLTSSKTETNNVMTTAADTYEPPFSGVLLAGSLLVAAGLFGILFNATRPIVKTSR